MNPYLAAAMMLAAGLEGIEKDLDPGDPIDENMYLLSDAELARRGVNQLPRTLLESIEAFAADPLSREVMGQELFDAYVELKTGEWWDYHNSISQWEIDARSGGAAPREASPYNTREPMMSWMRIPFTMPAAAMTLMVWGKGPPAVV